MRARLLQRNHVLRIADLPSSFDATNAKHPVGDNRTLSEASPMHFLRFYRSSSFRLATPRKSASVTFGHPLHPLLNLADRKRNNQDKGKVF